MTSSLFQAQDQAKTSLEPNIRSKMKTTNTSIGHYKDHNHNVLRTCPGRGENVFRDRAKTSPARGKNVSKTMQKRLQDEAKTSPKWTICGSQVVFKTSSGRWQNQTNNLTIAHCFTWGYPLPHTLALTSVSGPWLLPHHFSKFIRSKSWFLLFDKIRKHSRSIYKISVPWDQYLLHNTELKMMFRTGQLASP